MPGMADLVRTGQVTPQELLDEAIRRFEAVNPRINAVVHTYPLGSGRDAADCDAST